MRPLGVTYYTGHALTNILAPDQKPVIREAVKLDHVEFDEVLVVGSEVGSGGYRVLAEVNSCNKF